MYSPCHRVLSIVLAGLISLLPVACGGGSPLPAATGQPSTETDQTPFSGEIQPPPAGGLQERISNSPDITFGLEGAVLPSFHLEASGTEPVYNFETQQIVAKTFTYQADVAGDDVHLTTKTQTGDQPEDTTEGFIIDGGLAAMDSGGEEFEIVDGQIRSSLDVGLTWTSLPLSLLAPLTIAATGAAQLQGEENLDGRTAEKYSVDSRNAPPGVMETMGGIFSLTSAQATVWIDKETGALLKLVADYEKEMTDLTANETSVGTGIGHIELEVTRVGNTTVTPPQE